jgi:AraC-like DNA-binding protein
MDLEAPRRLERSCGPSPGDWLELSPSQGGLERLEAWFSGHAYDSHRHQTYAVGLTLAGIQAFAYRGCGHVSTPGQVIVLHPDEIHDGHAGSETGFGYRMIYLEPRVLLAALGCQRKALPFVPAAVARDPELARIVASAFRHFPEPLEELEADQLLVQLADALLRRDPSRRPARLGSVDAAAVDRARAKLDGEFAGEVSAADLEALSGLDRFALARQFRARVGTSPHRYLVARRVGSARALLLRGVPLAQAALASGFADQSHLTRHFRRVFGLPPGRFRRLVRP